MKHNFKKILCVLLACLMVIPFCTEFAKLPQIWAASSDIVDIPDVNMKAALNSALNVEDSSADITKEQLAQVYSGQITNWKDLGGSDQQIVVIGREASSGTRGAFEELLKLEDKCKYAQEIDSTGAVMAKVAATPGAIGYVSLDVIDDTVHTLKIDGAEATEENIKAGTYALQRPFVMATKGEISEQSEAVQELFNYINSDEGQQIISKVGLISAK